MAKASVSVLYYSRPPQHYVARLGATGWCEGWGWTVDEAVEDLARVIADVGVPPVGPAVAPIDHPRLVAWLRRHVGEPVLAS